MPRPASEQQTTARAPAGVAARPACPRCHQPVGGEFKFCPACAYRLKAGDLPPAEEPPLEASDRWLHALVAIAFGLLLIGVVLVGIRLFQEEPPLPSIRDVAEPLSRPLSVDEDLLESMVELLPGTADYVIRLVPPAAEGGDAQEVPTPVSVGPMRISKYEMTRGMYAEFIRDIQANPERVPEVLEGLWDPGEDPWRQGHLEAYVRAWWQPVVARLEEATGRSIPRPPELRFPLASRMGVLVAVPPAWIRIGNFEELTWDFPEGTENLPVTGVSWYEATAFAEWAGERLGVQLRLPTRKEWIRAAHGGETGTPYPWGKEPLRYACNNANLWSGDDEPLPVSWRYSDADGTTNDGLYAMAGNAREWTLNDYLVFNAPSNYFWPAWSQEFETGQVDAPTLGGSFQEGILDCEVTERSLVTFAKYDRARNVGFRLRQTTASGR